MPYVSKPMKLVTVWFTEEEKAVFRKELKAMIDHLSFFGCIVCWVPFNEGWGQHDTNEILQWTMKYDPTRLVDGPSGWTDRGGSSCTQRSPPPCLGASRCWPSPF